MKIVKIYREYNWKNIKWNYYGRFLQVISSIKRNGIEDKNWQYLWRHRFSNYREWMVMDDGREICF